MKNAILSLIILCAACGAYAKTEFGKLEGAEFRIDVPDNWNHGLVVYYHGYDAHKQGLHYDQSEALSSALAVFTNAGYAVVQSGYSRGGSALEQAIPETEALRKYFVEHYGAPSETYVTGHSMGGLLTVMTIEQFPENYAAGLDLCGAVGSWVRLNQRFDARVLFDYFFPGVLPNPAKIPASYEMTEELGKTVAARLESEPQAAEDLRHVTSLRSNKDLVGYLLFITWVLKDIEERAGGNPFDNRNTIYAGTSNDNRVNDGVKRYTADPGALAYLERYYTPTGHLTRPVLAIHTTYDPLVSPAVPSNYALLTRTAGAADFFVVQYVEHDGHCNITPEEIARGFAELRQWKEKGIPPTPGRLP